ncbi:type VI secretion system tip protein VgrG [Pseudoduganella sp. FT93W]|uniref:Type VI secretion system tip protein VgrG n=1 Tax=Duganella fentianensis TaxID=2692177 RepID=A0A845I4A3_9BURK|nr:type VI secretion system Vgr family protein [Duganella fentianensis]MYN46206.1 type VI secretion system tip protein VgrG [Duganella fentianensis]
MLQDIVQAGLVGLSVFGAGSQNNRLLRMDFPQGDGPANGVLLINKVKMQEELSRDFVIDVEVLSDDAHIPLKRMMGRMVTISLVREDGSMRYMNGYIGTFRFVRTDGGFAFYQMILQPWLAFAKLRKDNLSFHHRSVIELTEVTFAHYHQRDWRTHMSLDYDDRKLTCANQHNETDYNHLHRRWEAAGLYYCYEHRFDGHTLILSDNSTQAEPIDASQLRGAPDQICFRADAGSDEADGIRTWQAIRQLGSGKVTLASFNYKSPRAQWVSGYSLNQQGEVEAYELYENTGAYGYPNLDDGDTLAQRRMEEADQGTQYFEASGNDRAAQPGRIFKLADHFSAHSRAPEPDGDFKLGIGERDYLIVSVEHSASNNYPAGPDGKSEYSNSFVCIRRDIRWRPGRHYNSVPCAPPGVQTAIVVGPPGEDIYTDALGRIKLQFHWDRLGAFDQASSPWIRVMMPMAGPYFGQMCLPRVGQEVVVQFLDGNIDHPIVVGVVYNSTNMPPWNLPAQGALAGLRSRELSSGGNGGSNHLILDDTKGAMQVQLRSDHQHSQLSLGSITRIESSEGRMEARGEGWELATNAWGVARANRGMLITTEARPNGASHIKDMGETLQRLNSAHKQHDALAKLAQQSGAQDGAGQSSSVAAIRSQNDSIQGGTSAKSDFPQLAMPQLVLASPAGIETTTRGSTHLASDQHTALTTGQDLSIANGGSLFASVRQTFRLFVHKAGMRLVAAAGDIDLRALSNSVNVLAKLNITQMANRITISAKEEVVINGGGSYARFSAQGIEQGTNGNMVIHAAEHALQGPNCASVPTPDPRLVTVTPLESFDEQFRLVANDGKTPIVNQRYRISASDGTQWDGISNAEGLTERVYTSSPIEISLKLLSDKE